MKLLTKFYITIVCVLALSACGGGSDAPLKGTFVDAPVEGLTYITSSGLSGSTDASGTYLYKTGDKITFSIAGITFPEVVAAAVISPLELVGASSPSDPAALAIARILQSVDKDNNPDNGIVVERSKLVSNALAPAKWADASDANLGALLAVSTPLRSESLARQHLTSQLSSLSGDANMTLVSRYSSGGTAALPSLVGEIVSYHANSKSVFITVDTAIEPSSFKRIDLSALPSTALTSPTTSSNLTVSARTNVALDVNDSSFTAGGVQSLDVSNNLLAIAVQAGNKTDNGVIAFYNLSSSGSPTFVKKVVVGSLPDGVAFSPDGKYLVVANEAELSASFMTNGVDPEGTISLITINNGVPADTAKSLGFTDFNVGGSRASELPATVRIGRPGASVAQDLEPEYVAISEDSTTAFVTLQENNAVAVVDLTTQRISKIIPLGFKDHGGKYKIAPSDRYAGTSSAAYGNPTVTPTLKNYSNLYGVYLPDGIATYTVDGKVYFLTANEGDDRGDFLTGISEETARFSEIVSQLDPTAFPTADVDAIKTAQELGRLTLLTKDSNGLYGDTDGDGDFDRVYALGGRSFSIWSADTGAQIFDSGEDIERLTYNNIDDDSTNRLALLKAGQLLGRLDNKGPEVESVVVGKVGTQTYAFVGMERASAIAMYNITDPLKPKYVQYIRNSSDLADGDISPEGMKFIPADKSPNGVALLVVGYEVSGSVAVFQVK